MIRVQKLAVCGTIFGTGRFFSDKCNEKKFHYIGMYYMLATGFCTNT